eukprot:s442_g10.t1
MRPWAIRAWFIAQLCPASFGYVEDTCEDSVLLHARSHAILAKVQRTTCDDEALLDTGECVGSQNCTDCYDGATPPANNVPPSNTLDRFPNGRLLCGNGSFACANSNFNFKTSSDYMVCQGDRSSSTESVCAGINVSNVGAVCCSGARGCSGSNWQLSPLGGCQPDMCCGEFDKENSCGPSQLGTGSTVQGIDSISCRGTSSCRLLQAEVRRDVRCEGSETCDRGQFAVQAPGDHVVDCIDQAACRGSNFAFTNNSNISFTCSGLVACQASFVPSFQPTQISLTGDSCIDLSCSGTNACSGLSVSKTSTDSCYYQGPSTTRPAGCIQTTQPMCGNIQRAEICCQGSGGPVRPMARGPPAMVVLGHLASLQTEWEISSSQHDVAGMWDAGILLE